VPVYSTQFILGATTAPRKYTVPAGKVAVIKCITAVNTATVVNTVSLDIGGIYVWLGSIPAASNVNASGLGIVCTAGQVMSAAGGAALHFSISGYLLDVLAAREA
jgi:hypothetical protein